MNIGGVSGAFSKEYQETGGVNNSAVGEMSFVGQLRNVSAEKEAAGLEVYREYLMRKYGGVIIESVENDQHSVDRIGAGTSGTGNVVIAPNILEQMAKEPKKAAYYEGKIQEYFSLLPKYTAELSAMGHEIHSSGIIIHPDGTVTHYCCGDLKPEVRARIEAQIKAESEAKAERKRKFGELRDKAAEEQGLEREMVYRDEIRQEFISGDIYDISRLVFVDLPYVVDSTAVFAQNVII